MEYITFKDALPKMRRMNELDALFLIKSTW